MSADWVPDKILPLGIKNPFGDSYLLTVGAIRTAVAKDIHKIYNLTPELHIATDNGTLIISKSVSDTTLLFWHIDSEIWSYGTAQLEGWGSLFVK